ncbi:MAG: DMT family transporter, partial [Pseudomonadota bacterium]
APALPLSLVSGLFGHALPQIMVFMVTQRLPIGVVGLIIAMNPLMTALVGGLTGLAPVTRRQMAGIALGFVGIALVSLPGTGPLAPGATAWLLAGLVVPLCFAIANVFSAKLRAAGSDPVVNGAGMMGVSASFLLLACLISGQFWSPADDLTGLGPVVVGIHMVNGGLAFFLFFVVLALGGPIMVASASYLILLFATLWGWLFFDETPGLMFVIAAGLVVAGLALVLGRSGPRSRP